MPAPKNAFKNAIKNGEVQTGCWLGLTSTYSSEIVSAAGFDWVLIDGEHAPNDIPSISNQIAVIDKTKSTPIVRPVIGATWMIKQILDCGAQTILVPMVESANQARDLVKAMRYPPEGMRGVGAALARASAFNQRENYLETSNDQMCLLVQVESMAGVNALDDILNVEGVDGVFIGPADLAADMGHLGNPDHQDVQNTIDETIKKIVNANKAAGILTLSMDAAEHYVKIGATFVAVGIDVLLLANSAHDLATRAKKLKSS